MTRVEARLKLRDDIWALPLLESRRMEAADGQSDVSC